MEVILAQEQDTEALGARLAQACDRACVIYLYGDLGAGKTCLSRGFLRGLGYQGTVKSPTYNLVEPYQGAGRQVYHFDLYRLADARELEYLGLRDFLQYQPIFLVEWPERGKGILPEADISISLFPIPDDGRLATIEAFTPPGQEILARLLLMIKA